VLSLLGAGGMGEVYRARDPRLGRDVAIKVVASSLTRDDQARARFEREARAVAALSHPNILAIHDVGREGERVFAVTELLEGETLRERLQRGPLPLRRALETAAALAEGLAAAHRRGLVHRDLKPGNVFLTAEGRVKLLDFGLAKQYEPTDSEAETMSRTEPGTLLGTVGYMAPEQVAGKPADHRGDIFALGCVLYEMLTGERAFARATAAESLAAILNEEPPGLAEESTAIPREARLLTAHCLEKDPSARFQTAQDVAFSIRFALGASLPSAPIASTPSRTARRRGWLAAAGAAALLASTGAAFVLVARSRTAPPAPVDMAQLTYDEGYTAEPALSPDGRLAAYTSDRAGAGNLDLWVHNVGGGDPIQLTRDPADERQPSFSPDGARIAFRSERDGGGIYTIPALGGEPLLLVSGGYDARYSPDGRFVAYWTGPFVGFPTVPGAYRTFVVAASGGAPREIAGFTGARFPIWSPDGKWLLVVASQVEPPSAASFDWWSVPSDSARPPVPARVASVLQSAGARLGPHTRPSGWLGDEVIFDTGGELWAVELQPGRSARRARRLTFGPGATVTPAVSRGGRIAAAALTLATKIWSLPLDAETATVVGPPRRLTEGSRSESRATIAADGRTLAFFEIRAQPIVTVKDLATGRVTDLGRAGTFGAVVSRDGSHVAFPDPEQTAYAVSVRGGEPRRICTDCYVGDWLADGRHVTIEENAGRGTALRLVDTVSGESRDLVRPSEGVVNRPHVSADDRWLAFRFTVDNGTQSVVVAPLRPGAPPPLAEWVPVTEPERDVRPCGWSPSGRWLYLVSSRDGFRCLYAVPIDPAKGRPRGPAQLVYHLHNVRGQGGGGASVISTGAGNAILKDRVILDYPLQTANVWTLRLPVDPVASR
jgi:eukaryotic-like serine/threonine-protein kinase